jgi:hypothetical protein
LGKEREPAESGGDMQGQDVVTSDDHKLGTVVAERDDCVIVESGHVFKTRHAIPTEFLHEHDGVLRATVGKDVVSESPSVDGDSFDANAVKLHYGLIEVHLVDPDPDEDNAETEGARRGVDPAPSERLGTLGGANDPTIERLSEFDRADSSSFGGHPRTHAGINDRTTKPGETPSERESS